MIATVGVISRERERYGIMYTFGKSNGKIDGRQRGPSISHGINAVDIRPRSEEGKEKGRETGGGWWDGCIHT